MDSSILTVSNDVQFCTFPSLHNTHDQIGGECKRISLPVMESIPDELLFEILLCLPAHDIYSGARLVCRKWYHMIHTRNFISTHFEQATYGLLIAVERGGGVDFISVRNGDIETYKFTNCSFWGRLLNSCNGLVLEDRSSYNSLFRIANISTDQSISLPPYPDIIGTFWTAVMGYAAASGTYKVFAVHDLWCGKRCGIISVGLDKSWRFISTEHLSPSVLDILRSSPCVNECFMHWISEDNRVVVTLNVETETITEAAIPAVVGEKTRPIDFLSTGTYLSLLVSCGELEWEVWEMKSETGEWKKLSNICLESEKGRMVEIGLGLRRPKSLTPWGWVKYPEVLAFKFSYCNRKHNYFCFYDLVKREISSKKIETRIRCRVMHHKNSLVSPVGWRMLS